MSIRGVENGTDGNLMKSLSASLAVFSSCWPASQLSRRLWRTDVVSLPRGIEG